MAKPRELYSGAAPQAMSMMGMGIADAYANAGRLEGQGYAALGQGIGEGLKAAGQYIKEVKEIEKQNKSYENLLKNDIGRKFLGVSSEDADQYLAMLKDEKPSVKNKLLGSLFDDAMKARMINRELEGKKMLQTSEFDLRKDLQEKELAQKEYLQKLQIEAQLQLPYEQGRARSIYPETKGTPMPAMSLDPFAGIGGGASAQPSPTSTMPPAVEPPRRRPYNPFAVSNPFTGTQPFGLGVTR